MEHSRPIFSSKQIFDNENALYCQECQVGLYNSAEAESENLFGTVAVRDFWENGCIYTN